MQAKDLELNLEDTCEFLNKGKLLDLGFKSIQKAIENSSEGSEQNWWEEGEGIQVSKNEELVKLVTVKIKSMRGWEIGRNISNLGTPKIRKLSMLKAKAQCSVGRVVPVPKRTL